MIDAANVAQLWGDHFDRSVADMMNVQSDISKAIAENLRMQLTSDDHKVMVAGTTQNAEAYQLYLKGQYEYDKAESRRLQQSKCVFRAGDCAGPVVRAGICGVGKDLRDGRLSWAICRRARPIPKPLRRRRRRSLSTNGPRTPIRRLRHPPSITSGTGRKASRNYTGRSPWTRTTQKLTEHMV